MNTKKRSTSLSWLSGLALLLMIAATPLLAAGTPAPEFTQQSADDWLNSEPISLKDLKGKVVLLDIWSYGCWNCYRSFPWLHELEAKYEDQGLQVIGIHAPEFDHEKDKNNVMAKIEEFKIKHPVMLDNDFAYWNKLDNTFWPTFYIIDKSGNIRATSVGETHAGDKRAKNIEAVVKQLLEEPI